MRDRNEKTPEAAGTSLVPIPIGLVPLIKIVKVRTESINAVNKYPVFPFGIHTETMMAWKPKELHRFWNRLVKGTDV